MPFFEVAQSAFAHGRVYRIKVLGHRRPKLFAPGNPDAPFLVAEVEISESLVEFRSRGLATISGGPEPGGFDIARFTKGSEWIIVPSLAPADAPSTFWFAQCAEVALQLVNDRITGHFRQWPGVPETWTLDQLEAELHKVRRR